MNKIIVDTNIFFSAILNLNSRIGQILMNSKDLFDFYAPKYIRTELFRHQEKIKRITNLTDKEFLEIYELTIKNVTLLNHSIFLKKILK